MKRRSFFGSIAAALRFGGSVAASVATTAPPKPKAYPSLDAFLDDVRTLKSGPVAGEFIPKGSLVCYSDDGRIYRWKP